MLRKKIQKYFDFLEPKRPPQQIKPADAHQKLSEKNIAIIDVRERDEYESGHAHNALHIPLNELRDVERALLDGFEELFVICRTGARSMRGAEILSSLGYIAVSIEGGTQAWQKNNLPMNSL